MTSVVKSQGDVTFGSSHTHGINVYDTFCTITYIFSNRISQDITHEQRI